jgi:hypothetical protein
MKSAPPTHRCIPEGGEEGGERERGGGGRERGQQRARTFGEGINHTSLLEVLSEFLLLGLDILQQFKRVGKMKKW